MNLTLIDGLYFPVCGILSASSVIAISISWVWLWVKIKCTGTEYYLLVESHFLIWFSLFCFKKLFFPHCFSLYNANRMFTVTDKAENLLITLHQGTASIRNSFVECGVILFYNIFRLFSLFFVLFRPIFTIIRVL